MSGENGADELTVAITSMDERHDGYSNVMLGFGGAKDPSSYTTFQPRGAIDDVRLEALYVQEHFAAAIVEELPAYVLQAGWQLAVPGDPNKSAALRKAYATREQELDVVTKFAEGAWWGRDFGGAITWIGADDRAPLYTPLREQRIGRVNFLHSFDRRDVVIAKYYSDPRHPKYGQPEVFQVRPNTVRGPANVGTEAIGAGHVLLHESRCIVWPGQPTTRTRRIELQGWDDSILQRCWDALAQLGEDYAGKSLALLRNGMAFVKIHDLYKKIATPEGDTVLKRRMALFDIARSRSKTFLLDTREDALNVSTALTGVSEILDHSIARVAAASKTPRAILMGESIPDSDEATQESWDAKAVAWRELVFRPRHEKLTRILMLEQDSALARVARASSDGSKEPDQWSIAYRPLRVPSAKKRAEVDAINAQVDALNIDRGVYTADVAAHRYGADGADGVQLDPLELAQRAERRKALASAPPKDNAELGTVAPRTAAVLDVLERLNAKKISRDSALAILTKIHRHTEADAIALIGPELPTVTPAPAPPGPPPAPQQGQGAGAPPGLPGVNAGGAPG